MLDWAVVTRALAEDEAAARAEWLAEFRSDLESYISPEVVASLVTPGVRERGPSWWIRYHAFCDPAGGSGGDSMTLGVAHHDARARQAVLDVLLEVRPPFSPEDVAGQLAVTLVSTPPAASTIQNNTGVDVDFRFGTRATIDGVTVGSIVCDATVLSRGTTVCP